MSYILDVFIYTFNKYLLSANVRAYLPGTILSTRQRTVIFAIMEFTMSWKTDTDQAFKCVRERITLSGLPIKRPVVNESFGEIDNLCV